MSRLSLNANQQQTYQTCRSHARHEPSCRRAFVAVLPVQWETPSNVMMTIGGDRVHLPIGSRSHSVTGGDGHGSWKYGSCADHVSHELSSNILRNVGFQK